MRTQCTDKVHAIVVSQKKAGLVLGSNLVYSGCEFSLQLDNQSITIRNRTCKNMGSKVLVSAFHEVCDGWVGLGPCVSIVGWVGSIS